MQPTMYRQGDVLIRRVSDSLIPDGAKKNMFGERCDEPVERDEQDRIVLAYGEVTGHAHAITDPGVIAWNLPGHRMLLAVPKEGATVQHEEHGAIALPEGAYEVVRQREFTGADEARYVAD
jgi:hypothetical protein